VRLPWLAPDAPFPAPESALHEPNGLLCAGADLSVSRLRLAYASGIFPWFNAGEPILWWAPDPRFVLTLADFALSTRDQRSIRSAGWTVRHNTRFADVMRQCAAPRANYPGAGTWLSTDMQDAYLALHAAGDAHSVEIFADNTLIGGIYGVSSGRVFCGESMFGTRSNASKAALAALVAMLRSQGYTHLDCQIASEHLRTRGAVEMSRADFLKILAAR
jgi:leucyl/phenylalanyl-tRNA---protein transferase